MTPERKKYLNRWLVIVSLALAAAFILPFPMNVVQAAVCGASLGAKLYERFIAPKETA